jgi:long-subunit acyl-CoA synthetase (AMP-forming)
MSFLATEWQIIDAAAQSYGMVSVSLYDTLGKDAVCKYSLDILLVW